jgi:hypothetical protein
MIGTILYIVAIGLFPLIALINFFWVLTVYGWNLKTAGGYFRSLALDIDIMSNRAFRTIWNNALVKQNKHYYRFGKIGETISSALGKNEARDTLSKAGKALVWILDKIDKKHCYNSINYNV